MFATFERDFTKRLQGLSDSRHKWRAFSDWLEIAAIALHQLPYHSGDFQKDATFEALEETYLKKIKGFKRAEQQDVSAMLGITLAAHEAGFSDFLGKIAAEQELLNPDGGQFFTPYNVCLMMARMTLADVRSVIDEKGIITIAEPACGGGAMVIACAEALWSQKIDPRSCAQFDCIDVSRDAFNMCYIQLSALGLQAVVRHGNTLSMDFWEHRPTPQLRYFDQWLKEHHALERLQQLRDLFTNPEAFVAERSKERGAVLETSEPPPPSSEDGAAGLVESNVLDAEQGSLFDLDTFAPVPKKRTERRRRADIVLPPNKQLDLFSENPGGQ